jgi:hypothetical protein
MCIRFLRKRKKVPEIIEDEKVAESIEDEQVPESIGDEKVPEPIEVEKVPESIGDEIEEEKLEDSLQGDIDEYRERQHTMPNYYESNMPPEEFKRIAIRLQNLKTRQESKRNSGRQKRRHHS